MLPIAHATVTALLMLCSIGAIAQTRTTDVPAARTGDTVQWQARALDNTSVDARTARGKVAVVFVWSTACAVCRSALPELRANAAGWVHKPFQLVTLNVDPRRDDWLAYEQLASRATAVPPNMRAYWMGNVPPASRLPVTLVLDSDGRVVARHEGRMAPQAWDTVADLLL